MLLLLSVAWAQQEPSFFDADKPLPDVRPPPRPAAVFDCPDKGAPAVGAPPAPSMVFVDTTVVEDPHSAADYVTNSWSAGLELQGSANDPDSRHGVCLAYYDDGPRMYAAPGRSWDSSGGCTGLVPTQDLPPGSYWVGLTFKDNT